VINNGGLQLVYEILMETGTQNILKALQVGGRVYFSAMTPRFWGWHPRGKLLLLGS
jgi:hypothetical protein